MLCNHQRAVPKTHEKSMQKMLDNITRATEQYEGLKKDLSLAKAGKPTQEGKNVSVETCARRANPRLRWRLPCAYACAQEPGCLTPAR